MVQVCRHSECPTAPRSPTWRPSMAQRWVSSPLTRRLWRICNLPRAPLNRSRLSKPTARSRCFSVRIRRPRRSLTTRWNWIWERLSRRSPAPSVRRTASRCGRQSLPSPRLWKERQRSTLPFETTATRLTFQAGQWLLPLSPAAPTLQTLRSCWARGCWRRRPSSGGCTSNRGLRPAWRLGRKSSLITCWLQG